MHHVFVEKQGYTLCLIFNTFMTTSNSSILLLLFLFYFSLWPQKQNDCKFAADFFLRIKEADFFLMSL